MGGLFCFFVLSVVALLLSWKDWGLNVVAGIKGEFFVHCSFWAFLLFDLIDVLVFYYINDHALFASFEDVNLKFSYV
jgi:hypothetical protein